MKKRILTALCLLCAVSLLATASLADSLTLTGTVTAGKTVEVYAPIGGTIAKIAAEVGQEVATDDVLYTLKTTKVYAEENGVVTGIFGEPGDSAATITSRYGAVMYLEGDSVYSVSASTETAYNTTDTKCVHVGETVYLKCRSNADRTGVGTITSIDAYFEDPAHFKVQQEWLDELEKVSHRPYTTGFYYHQPTADDQLYGTSSYQQTSEFIGLVRDYDTTTQYATVEQRNNMKIGQEIEVFQPNAPLYRQVLSDMLDEECNPIAVAPHAQQIVKIYLKSLRKDIHMWKHMHQNL